MLDIYGVHTGWEHFFPEDIIPAALDLMIEAWPQRIRTNEKEEPITRGYVHRMQSLKNYRQAPNIRIIIEELELTVNAEIKGRIDFKFVHGHNEDVYFAWEAKRLHITSARPNYAAYTGEDGMGCFISGKYSSTQVRGGMLGYVMDADVRGAWKGVCNSMKQKSSSLCLQGQPTDVSQLSLPKDCQLAESNHDLTKKQMRLLHLLLPLG